MGLPWRVTRKLGHGSFGDVYRGARSAEPAVAVKMLRAMDGCIELIERELEHLKLFQEKPHDNVIRAIFVSSLDADMIEGVDTSGYSHLLVMELGVHSLNSEIYRTNGQVWTWGKRGLEE